MFVVVLYAHIIPQKNQNKNLFRCNRENFFEKLLRKNNNNKKGDTMSNKWVYTFGDGHAEGRADMRNLLGGKGANLAEMNLVGLPVPAGFTVTTEVCTYYYENNQTYPADLMDQVRAGIAHIENIMGKKFADMENPLLVSVRSGARVSMPGMMDTVLNLGLNDETVRALAKISGN